MLNNLKTLKKSRLHYILTALFSLLFAVVWFLYSPVSVLQKDTIQSTAGKITNCTLNDVSTSHQNTQTVTVWIDDAPYQIDYSYMKQEYGSAQQLFDVLSDLIGKRAEIRFTPLGMKKSLFIMELNCNEKTYISFDSSIRILSSRAHRDLAICGICMVIFVISIYKAIKFQS